MKSNIYLKGKDSEAPKIVKTKKEKELLIQN